MTSKRRIRRQMCDGKKSWKTKEECEAFKKEFVETSDRPEQSARKMRSQHPYKCDFCGRWHLGHKTARRW
jgi:hypothetical protein